MRKLTHSILFITLLTIIALIYGCNIEQSPETTEFKSMEESLCTMDNTSTFSINDFDFVEFGKTKINDVCVVLNAYPSSMLALSRGNGYLFPTENSSEYICVVVKPSSETILDIFLFKDNSNQK